jgi:activating signal cointegrator 1
MHMITLHQPWASLCFTPFKEFETRSRPYPAKLLGERIAIHAAARPVVIDGMSGRLRDICYALWGTGWSMRLPFGSIIGTVELGPCIRISALTMTTIRQNEQATGDWQIGRWAWQLNDPRRCNPIISDGIV